MQALPTLSQIIIAANKHERMQVPMIDQSRI
jgi:hypothetical protein